MPAYCFMCPECDEKDVVFSTIADRPTQRQCGICTTPMIRDFVAEHASVRGDYNEPIVSTSMAFDAKEVAEHRKIGRLKLRWRDVIIKYMKEKGVHIEEAQ